MKRKSSLAASRSVQASVFFGACLSAAGAHAQSKVEVYGITTAGLGYSDKVVAGTRVTARRVGLDSGQYTQSRIGFRGAEDLGDGLKASFVIEGGLAIDTGVSSQGSTFGRRTTVGLSGAFGDLQLGRRKDFTDEVSSDYSSETRFLPFTGKSHANNMDRSTGERGNNLLYYTSPNLGGLKVNAAYALGEAPGSKSSGTAIGFGAQYNNGGFGIGFGYWQSRLGTVVTGSNSSSDVGASSNAGCNTVGLGQPGNVCLKTWILGSSYDFGPLTVRGTLSQARQPLLKASAATAPNFASTFTSTAGSGAFAAGGSNNARATIVDAGVDYNLGSSWLLKASVIGSRYKFLGAARDGKLLTLAVGADYILSKRTLIYGMLGTMSVKNMYSPGITSAGAPGIDNRQTALALGLMHRF